MAGLHLQAVGKPGFKIAVAVANVSQSSQNSHILLPLELIVHTDMYVGTRSDRYVDIISECSHIPLSVAPSSNIHIGMHNQCGWSGKRILQLLRDILAMVAAVLKLRLQIRISLSECDSTSFSTRPSPPLIFRGYPKWEGKQL